MVNGPPSPLSGGAFHLVAAPGNGTSYDLVLTRHPHGGLLVVWPHYGLCLTLVGSPGALEVHSVTGRTITRKESGTIRDAVNAQCAHLPSGWFQ